MGGGSSGEVWVSDGGKRVFEFGSAKGKLDVKDLV